MKNIFITAGMGDFIAIESCLTTKEKKQVENVYLATPALYIINRLLPFCFPNMVSAKVVFDNFNLGDKLPPHPPTSSFGSLKDAIGNCPEIESRIPRDIDDLNSHDFNKLFMEGERTYVESSLLKNVMADISRLNLPSKYMIIHPHSIDRSIVPERNVDAKEWMSLIRYLTRHDLYGVIINTRGGPEYPIHERIINMAGQTSILESIEIIRRGYGFFGSASGLSLLAARVFDPSKIFIKSPRHFSDAIGFYYAPLVGEDFIYPRLTMVR